MMRAISRIDRAKAPAVGSQTSAEAPQPLSLRLLEVFRQVYEEREYASAGFGLGTSGRSVKKSLNDMRTLFGGELFSERNDGQVLPSPFADRLFNDTKGLDAAVTRLMEKVEAIRDQGRVLRVGTTPAIFRTSAFRAVFRELQAMEGFRIAYVQLPQSGASKALLQSRCDWYVGFDGENGERFISEKIAKIPLKDYLRGQSSEILRTPIHSPTPPRPAGKRKCDKLPGNIVPIPEERWIHWLDHPADCEEGILVRAPEMTLDSRFWTEVKGESGGGGELSLQATFLKQHPFEFLPKLAGRLRESILSYADA